MSIGEFGGAVFLGFVALAIMAWIVSAVPGDTTR